MAEKSTKTKRRALLMSQAEPAEPAEPEPPKPSQEPQPLLGDAFDRMRMDPEIKEFRRKLLLGTGIVGAIVAVLVALSLFHSYSENKAKRELFGGENAQAKVEDTASPSPPVSKPAPLMAPEEALPAPSAPETSCFARQAEM